MKSQDMPYQALVIGADSYVGSALIKALRARGCRVLGTTRRPHASWGTVSFDLRDPGHLPRAAITYFCAGITRVRECAEFPDLAHQVNVVGPAQVAADMVASGGRVVMLSSSAAETLPGSIYGGLKLAAERNIMIWQEYAAVFRFGPLMKPGRSPYADQDYQPLPLADVIEALVKISIDWAPGLHTIKRPAKQSAMVSA